MKASDVKRRNRMDQWTPAEKAIQDAVEVVEKAGAHPLLTEAVNLLGKARDTVADFVDCSENVDVASVYRCAGVSCPGLPYKASDIPHPPSCATRATR